MIKTLSSDLFDKNVKKKPIRVLHIAMGSGNFGGATRFAVNYYRHIDRRVIIFDFLFCNANSLTLLQKDELFTESRVFALHALNNYKNSLREYMCLIHKLKEFFNNNPYKIIHVDSGSLPIQICCLYSAYKSGISIRIAHSHSAGGDYSKSWRTFLKKSLKPIEQQIIRKLATNYLACSKTSADNLFGKTKRLTADIKYIPNAIDTDTFQYDENKRTKKRNEMGILSNTVLLGHVGRFDKVKNHTYLLDIFNELHKVNTNSLLCLIGDGPLRECVEKKINQLELYDSVLLLGEQNNVDEYYQAFDALVMPSFFEGLSIVAIEAQTSGLPVFASSQISAEHSITSNITYLDINSNPKIWANTILKKISDFNRKNMSNIVRNNGYEIENAAKVLEEFYVSLLEDCNVKK